MMTLRRLLPVLTITSALAVAGALLSSTPGAIAQGSGSGAEKGSGSGAGKGSGSGAGSAAGSSSGAAAAKSDTSAPSKEFAAANEKMHKGMDIVFSGDADVDFVKGMIPHHAGAVDMARIVIKYGKDPDLKKLAESIISAQESEIVFMRVWLQKQGK